jgi:uncharacterized membrane protein YhfC
MSLAVILTFIFVIVLEIAIPLLLGYVMVKKFDLRWIIFLYGALFFILAQVIHIPLLLVLQPPYTAWVSSITSDPAMILAAVAIFLGLFAGILEEGIRYLVFIRFFPRKSLALRREQGLLFGAGWGCIECIFVAVLVVFSLINYALITSGALDTLLANTSLIDPAQLAALDTIRNLTPLDILPGLIERIMTLILQITFTLLVMFAVVRARILFLLAAAGWHTFIDAVAVYAGQMYGIWPTEAFLALNAIAGIGVLYWVWVNLGDRELVEPGTDPE